MNKITPTYAFVVDGKTEAWYLQMLKRNERSINIAIRPQLAQKKSIKAQYEQVCELAEDYLTVFWVMDMDTLIKEMKENPQSNTKSTLGKCLARLPKNAHFIPNVPCLEYWFLLHFKNTSRFYPSYKTIEHELHKITELKDYEKTEKYYTSPNDIYKRMRPFLDHAMANASILPELDFDNLEKGVCKMHEIFKRLRIL